MGLEDYHPFFVSMEALALGSLNLPGRIKIDIVQ
jgi:hypothetical protein